MAELFYEEDPEHPQFYCWDRKYYNEAKDQVKALKDSKTLYVGNLSFFTTELQIHETFSVVGPIKRVIMGLNAQTKSPCGFCFVEYYTREHAEAALKFVSETVCDERIIRADMDGGFRPGRQYGRGRNGGQIRDERRQDYDPARGGVKPVTGKRGRDGEDKDTLLNSGLSSGRPPAPDKPFPRTTPSSSEVDTKTGGGEITTAETEAVVEVDARGDVEVDARGDVEVADKEIIKSAVGESEPEVDGEKPASKRQRVEVDASDINVSTNDSSTKEVSQEDA